MDKQHAQLPRRSRRYQKPSLKDVGTVVARTAGGEGEKPEHSIIWGNEVAPILEPIE